MVQLGSRSAAARHRPEGLIEPLAGLSRPAVVDYAAAGERVELSGRVLVNWAAKTANLLDEVGTGPQTTVLVDLPAGWKSLALLLGVLWTGAEVRVAEAGPEHTAGTTTEPDVVITDAPQRHAHHPGELVAVSPGAHDEDFGAPLDDGVTDFSSEVRIRADQCVLASGHVTPEGVQDRVRSHADDSAGAPAAGSVVDAPAGTEPPSRIQRLRPHARGVLAAVAAQRLTAELVRAAAHSWARLEPLVLVGTETVDAPEAQRLAAVEDLGEPSA